MAPTDMQGMSSNQAALGPFPGNALVPYQAPLNSAEIPGSQASRYFSPNGQQDAPVPMKNSLAPTASAALNMVASADTSNQLSDALLDQMDVPDVVTQQIMPSPIEPQPTQPFASINAPSQNAFLTSHTFDLPGTFEPPSDINQFYSLAHQRNLRSYGTN